MKTGRSATIPSGSATGSCARRRRRRGSPPSATIRSRSRCVFSSAATTSPGAPDPGGSAVEGGDHAAGCAADRDRRREVHAVAHVAADQVARPPSRGDPDRGQAGGDGPRAEPAADAATRTRGPPTRVRRPRSTSTSGFASRARASRRRLRGGASRWCRRSRTPRRRTAPQPRPTRRAVADPTQGDVHADQRGASGEVERAAERVDQPGALGRRVAEQTGLLADEGVARVAPRGHARIARSASRSVSVAKSVSDLACGHRLAVACPDHRGAGLGRRHRELGVVHRSSTGRRPDQRLLDLLARPGEAEPDEAAAVDGVEVDARSPRRRRCGPAGRGRRPSSRR